MEVPALPNELILHIIRCLIPSPPPVAFAAPHPVTKTLLNLTLVSRLTSGTAKGLLLKHCLYIESSDRLAKLIHLRERSLVDLTTAAPKGLFLSPFPQENLDFPSIAQNVSLLLSDIKRTLTRLVINLPLRYLRPEYDEHLVRPVLREAFSGLTALEEFCSMQDELYLDTDEHHLQPSVWPTWPQLRRLALYNACVDDATFVAGIKRCFNLTHLVLPRADGIFYQVPNDPVGFGALAKLKRVVVINTKRGFSHDLSFDEDGHAAAKDTLLGRLRSAWLSHNVGQASVQMSEPDHFCVAVEVPIPPNLEQEGDSDISLCQEWVGNRAVDGTLWDVTGNPFLDWPRS
ncbi:hypothetical protein I7I48_10531 [Histoplasma ohiense]|nr:hypothetical protein I7I48_10531 [Histoplasma ohiense (nom. inval.)]